jgi:hypothetical protein
MSEYRLRCIGLSAWAIVALIAFPSSVVFGQSVSCTTVTRAHSTICTATGGTHYKNWQFEGVDGSIVSRGTTVDSPTWIGLAVQSGGLSVDITTASGVTTVYGTLSVTPRTLTPFLLTPATPANQSPGYTCTASGLSPVVLSLPSPPTNSGTGDNVLGKYCNIDGFSYGINSVADTGPNGGYLYVASVTSQTQFHWVYSNDLANTSSAFYVAQCGNYNAQTNASGYIAGAQLAANTIHHESGTTTSHYAEWVASLANVTVNPGSRLEGIAQVDSMAAFQSYVSATVASNISTNNSQTITEPCSNGYGVSDDASCKFDGFVNFANGSGQYATCK